MADDVIKHLTTIDIFENHVVVMLVNDHFSHSAYVWMVEEHRECCFTKGTDLLGGILGRLLRGCLSVARLLRSAARVDTGQYFDCKLLQR